MNRYPVRYQSEQLDFAVIAVMSNYDHKQCWVKINIGMVVVSGIAQDDSQAQVLKVPATMQKSCAKAKMNRELQGG